MYNLTEKQRNIIAGIVLVLVLIGLSFWNRVEKKGKDQVSYDENLIITEDGITTDLRASEQLFETVASADEIEKDVRDQLGTDRQIKAPEIPDSSLKISKVNTAQGIAAYIGNAMALVEDYNLNTDEFMAELYAETITEKELNTAEQKTGDLIRNLYAIAVPQDAVVLHKSIINVFVANEDLIQEAKKYRVSANEDTWKEVYYVYGVINDSLSTMNKNYTELKQKYGLVER